MNLQVLIAVVFGLAAVVEDILRHRISNWIPAALFTGGLAYQIAMAGWRGALSSILGAAAGLGIFLVFYILGGMGGGDVKLMCGFGSLLGTKRLLEAALWTAGAGGLLALAVLAFRALRRRNGADRTAPDSIPYAPAIAVGVWLSLVPKG